MDLDKMCHDECVLMNSDLATEEFARSEIDDGNIASTKADLERYKGLTP
jgi:hypothetical protein